MAHSCANLTYMPQYDYATLASELLRALRGERSQVQLARRMGYRSNVAATWESGRRYPTASTALRVAERSGVDLRAAWAAFFRAPPPWLADVDPGSPDGVARLLSDLRGGTPIGEVARRAGVSRFAASRWLKGTAEPRLPEFLAMIEATSLRLLDWVAVFTDPAGLGSVAAAWERLERHRRVAYDVPWSQAVLRALELAEYQEASHEDGWIARRLGLSEADEARCLEALADTGQIRWDGTRWVGEHAITVDTRRDAAASRALKRWWAQVGLDRLPTSDGLFSYNVFTVSDADLERLRALHLAYFRELRAIVAASEPADHVVVANVQLFRLDESR